jgi:hypothetical protein
VIEGERNRVWISAAVPADWLAQLVLTLMRRAKAPLEPGSEGPVQVHVQPRALHLPGQQKPPHA